MAYTIYFDLAQAGFRAWQPLSVGLTLTAVGAVLVFAPKLLAWLPGLQGRSRRLFSWSYFLFALTWTIIASIGTYSSYRAVRAAEDEGRFTVVEGTVQNFHPMPYGGHSQETFEVDGMPFHYSDYDGSPGFHTTASHGGPIREGLPVRISFAGTTILKLEIASDSLPSAAALTAAAATEKARSDQQLNDSPTFRHMTFGLWLAGMLFIVAMNLDYRHYIRYWRPSGPPYERKTEVRFRIGFALAFCAMAWQLAHSVIAQPPMSFDDYWQGATDSLIWIGFMVVVDGFRRWQWRQSGTARLDR
jgi:hypothetical protein